MNDESAGTAMRANAISWACDSGGTRARRCNALCLFVAQSGHPKRAHECPLSGVKRTSKFRSVTSAFDPKRTLGSRSMTCA